MRNLLAAIVLLFFATLAQGQPSTRIIAPGIAVSTGPGAFTYEAPADTAASCWEEVPYPERDTTETYTIFREPSHVTLEWKASPWVIDYGFNADAPSPTVEMETAVVSEETYSGTDIQEDYLVQNTSTRSVRLSYLSYFGEQSTPSNYRVIVPFGDGGAAYIYHWDSGDGGFSPGERVNIVNYPFSGVVQEAEIWHPGMNKHLVPLPRIVSGDTDLTFVRIGDICQYVPTNSIVPVE